jgi:hypothetical protein
MCVKGKLKGHTAQDARHTGQRSVNNEQDETTKTVLLFMAGRDNIRELYINS